MGLALIDGEQVLITAGEARILGYLQQNFQGAPILGDTIADLTGLSRKAIRVHISNIQQKIHHTRLMLNSKGGPAGGYWLRWLPER